MPVGPKTLWPEKTKKSAPRSCTSARRWGTDCAPSIRIARVVTVGERRHLADGDDGAERVRDLGHRDELRARAEQARVLLEDHLAAVGDGHDLERRALLPRQQLPRDDVRVVLERREDDLVAGAEVLAAPRLRDEVDRLGRAAREDDLLGARRVEEPPDDVAGVLVGLGRAPGELVRGAVDVAVVAGVVARDRVDHGLRLLRGRGVVEPDQRASRARAGRARGSRGAPSRRRRHRATTCGAAARPGAVRR